jgi:hypothetical protein
LTSIAIAPRVARGNKVPSLKLALALSVGALVFGLIAGQLVASGKGIAVFGLAVVLVPVAMWMRPQIAPVVLMATALVIEQVGQRVVPTDAHNPSVGSVVAMPDIPITSHIPLFQGLGSLHLEPADLLLLIVTTIYLVRGVEGGPRWRPRTHVSASVFAVLGMVLVGIFIGMSHHGQLRESLMEARPWVYLGSAYLLTAVMIRDRAGVRAVLWGLVLATGLKAAQGLIVFMQVSGMHPRPESVLGHEEAYFFALFIFLVLALWLFNVPAGRLRKTATWLLPVVIGANLANNRRAAWILLGFGLLTIVVIGYRALPFRRRAISRGAAALLAISAVYLPIYWNKDGGLAQPARAIHSMISPDPRDAASNLYRVQEDANLELNIHGGGLLGKGFGVPIDYALPIVDIKSIDPLIAYVPHNGVLYVMMRMGVLGAIALWAMLATGIVAGCRVARSADREIAVVGALMAAALIAYALEGALDQGFFFYRIAFVTGGLLGLGEAARRIQRAGSSRHGRSVVTATCMGGR